MSTSFEMNEQQQRISEATENPLTASKESRESTRESSESIDKQLDVEEGTVNEEIDTPQQAPRRKKSPSIFAIPDAIDVRDYPNLVRASQHILKDGGIEEARPTSLQSIEPDDREFILRHSLAYFVACSFVVGSLLFLVGALASLYKFGTQGTSEPLVFVTAPYIAGSIAYTFGSYCGFLAVINLARRDEPPAGQTYHPFRYWAVMRTRRGWWSTSVYMVGSLLYNVGCFAIGVSSSSPAIVPSSFTTGSVFFVVGGCLDVWVNTAWIFRPRKLSFWSSWMNLVGSIFFTVGSISEIFGNKGAAPANWAFLIGSCLFFASGTIGIIMWGLEQYGYNYLPELNILARSPRAHLHSYHLIFILVYCCSITISVFGISLSIRCEETNSELLESNQSSEVLAEILRLFLPLGLLAVGTVSHMIPERPPFSYLLWWFRLTVVFQIAVCSVQFSSMCAAYNQEKGADDGAYI
jgi:hypothetical protein